MTVVHVDTGVTWRGGQQQVLLLHRELLQRGLDSRLLARGQLLDRCRAEGLPVRRLSGRMIWDPRPVAAVLGAAVRNQRGLILHVHDSRAHTLGALARRAWPETLLVCHRRVSYPPGGGAGSRWKRRQADAWIAVSSEVSRTLQGAGVSADVVTVIHSAVDVGWLQAAAASADVTGLRASLGIPESVPVIGFAGAFTLQKGHAVLIEAAPAVLRTEPAAVFLLPGAGELLPSLRARVQDLGMSAAFRFPGFRPDVAALTALWTVAVVPSIAGEGSAAAIKEPMALGVPVVASDLPGNLEVLAGAGLSFRTGVGDELAGQVLRLLHDRELRQQLACAGRDRVAAFTPATMAERTLQVYQRLRQ